MRVQDGIDINVSVSIDDFISMKQIRDSIVENTGETIKINDENVETLRTILDKIIRTTVATAERLNDTSQMVLDAKDIR